MSDQPLDASAQGGAVRWEDLKPIADQHGFNSPQYAKAYQAFLTQPLPEYILRNYDKEIAPKDGEQPPKEQPLSEPKITKPEKAPEKLPKATGGSVDHHPSDAQKAAGNYAKKRLSFHGLPVTIENEKGSTRKGVDAGGKPWSVRVPADYGYVRGTEGADGDQVDCYLGPNPDSKLVVVVNQQDHRTKLFDEHKCLLGYDSEQQALRDYMDGFSDGHGRARIGSVEVMSLDAFKRWLKDRKATRKPAHGPSIVEHALRIARNA